MEKEEQKEVRLNRMRRMRRRRRRVRECVCHPATREASQASAVAS